MMVYFLLYVYEYYRRIVKILGQIIVYFKLKSFFVLLKYSLKLLGRDLKLTLDNYWYHISELRTKLKIIAYSIKVGKNNG